MSENTGQELDSSSYFDQTAVIVGFTALIMLVLCLLIIVGMLWYWGIDLRKQLKSYLPDAIEDMMFDDSESGVELREMPGQRGLVAKPRARGLATRGPTTRGPARTIQPREIVIDIPPHKHRRHHHDRRDDRHHHGHEHHGHEHHHHHHHRHETDDSDDNSV